MKVVHPDLISILMDSNLGFLLKLRCICISWETDFFCVVIHNQRRSVNSAPVALKRGCETTKNKTVFLAVSALNCWQSADSLFDIKQLTGGFLPDVYFGVYLVAESIYHIQQSRLNSGSREYPTMQLKCGFLNMSQETQNIILTLKFKPLWTSCST